MIAIDVVIGAAVAVEQAAADALAQAGSGLRQPIGRLGRVLGDAEHAALRRLGELAESGAARRERLRLAAGRALGDAIAAAGTSWPVDRVIDAQLDRVVRGVVDRVLGLLESEPDRIRALVRGQRETMVGEVVGRVRDGAAAGDAALDRLTLRMTHRDRGPRPPGP